MHRGLGDSHGTRAEPTRSSGSFWGMCQDAEVVLVPAGNATGISLTCPKLGTGQPHSSDTENNDREKKEKTPRNKDNENNGVFQ